VVIPTFMIFTAIPPILSGLLLMWVFAVKLRGSPLTGAYGLTVEPGWSWEFANPWSITARCRRCRS
jgi:peptide/nickel transport system permease protein